IFGIGGIEHQQAVLRQPRMEPLHLVEGKIGASRVVWIGKEDYAGPGTDPSKDRIYVGVKITLRCDHRNCAIGSNDNVIDEEAVLCVYGFVPCTEIAMCQQLQNLVRP